MRRTILEAVLVACLCAAAVGAVVYLAERSSLRHSHDVGMNAFWEVFESLPHRR